MVIPLRSNNIVCETDGSEDGLYIVGQSNAEGYNIPHLPRIIRSDTSINGMSLAVAGMGDKLPFNLKCDELFDNYSDGDIVWVNSRFNQVRSVISSRSTANSLLLTERCENRCLFCSQPPNYFNDVHLYHQAALALLNYNTSDYVGLTGGEPTYNEHAFITLLSTLNIFNNRTKLHILSNGRRFSDMDFTKRVTDHLEGRDVLWGIPLYGHYAGLHDHLVGGKGAFIDTARGLSNLLNQGQNIELRIVPVANNLSYLNNIIEFITSNYLNIRIISIMNVEPKGYARKNFDSLYVSVHKQLHYLEQAIDLAERYGLQIRLFNYPLCLINEYLRNRAVQSISDWKNYYADECSGCRLKPQCGGLFVSSAGRFLENIRRIK